VAAALDKRIKHRSVVEVELASKVADRLIGWSKTFGVFVAAPVAVLLGLVVTSVPKVTI
jgi:hypothetical protein